MVYVFLPRLPFALNPGSHRSCTLSPTWYGPGRKPGEYAPLEGAGKSGQTNAEYIIKQLRSYKSTLVYRLFYLPNLCTATVALRINRIISGFVITLQLFDATSNNFDRFPMISYLFFFPISGFKRYTDIHVLTDSSFIRVPIRTIIGIT